MLRFLSYLVPATGHSPWQEQRDPLGCEVPYIVQRKPQLRGLLMRAWVLDRVFQLQVLKRLQIVHV